MIRRFLAVAIFATGAISHAQPSLPSSFQAKTIHSPEGADSSVCHAGESRRKADPSHQLGVTRIGAQGVEREIRPNGN